MRSMNRKLRLRFALGAALFTVWATQTMLAFQKVEQLPEVGSILPAKAVPKDNRHLYMTHSGQLRPFPKRD